MTEKRNIPRILAPAGDRDSFLAALAAGADAVYCGLKIFSARMEAQNFGIEELSTLVTLARSRGVAVYVAFNSLIKQGELEKTARILKKLVEYVNPHALIIQDPAVKVLARKAGYQGELHLSTLGNASFAKGLESVKNMGFNRAVLPRELTVDEIKAMAEQAPPGLDLEVFIHGALCYAVSGRCYWSSWFGGRSGLRGRCVQPCRRMYRQKNEKARFFSCLDLSVDVLVKVLKTIPEVTTWKIEGRKKSPHYVFYTVKAYKMLRDEGHDPQKKKIALSFLDYAMGRPSTHYNFLSQRQINPLEKEAETGSGLFAGRIKKAPAPFLITREALFKGDLLRIGYEDDQGHAIQRVTRSVPKKGKLTFNKRGLQKGAPVFIVDRKEPEVTALIQDLAGKLSAIAAPEVRPVTPGKTLVEPLPVKRKKQRGSRGILEMVLSRRPPKGRIPGAMALWVSPDIPPRPGKARISDVWWWLPPMVWPGEEQGIAQTVTSILKKGGQKFVLNMPWQEVFFPKNKGLELWAGPFCNVANTATVQALKSSGFTGAMVSPELGSEEYLTLPKISGLPLGMVVKGNWPLCISRIVSPDIKTDTLFTSPMGEGAWVSKRDNSHWVFPQWELDITPKRRDVERAGYKILVTINEPVPRGIAMKNRQGLWNWNMSVL